LQRSRPGSLKFHLNLSLGRTRCATGRSFLKDPPASRRVGDRCGGFFASGQTRRSGRRGARLAQSATAERPRGLGAGARSADDVGGGEDGVRSPGVCSGWRWRCAHRCRCARRAGRPGVEAAGRSFARAGMMGFAVLGSTGSIRMARPRRCRSRRSREDDSVGVMTGTIPRRPVLGWGLTRRRLRSGPSLVVRARVRGGRAGRSRRTRAGGGRRR
jgi:hypothetical protein